MARRWVICLMFALISSPKQLNGAATRDRRATSTSTSTLTTTTTTGVAGDYDTSQQLDDALSGLETALHFMRAEATNMNLDAIIGTRMTEGQLSVLLRRLDSNSSDLATATVTRQRIRNIIDVAGYVSDVATPYIQLRQREYFNEIGAIIGRGFWRLDYKSRDVNKSAATSRLVDGETLKEDFSDHCIGEILGTTGKTKMPCAVSRDCWQPMTAPGYRFYSLTHQVFYLEIAEAVGCFTPNMMSTVDDMNQVFCANVYDEGRQIAANGFPQHKRDLFMEQAAVCGMLGYRDMFESDWLNAILSWQRHPRGCWSVDEYIISQPHLHRFRRSFLGPRDKRRERVLEDGCSCHKTAVAIAALAQYIRYIIEASLAAFNHSLNFMNL